MNFRIIELKLSLKMNIFEKDHEYNSKNGMCFKPAHTHHRHSQLSFNLIEYFISLCWWHVSSQLFPSL